MRASPPPKSLTLWCLGPPPARTELASVAAVAVAVAIAVLTVAVVVVAVVEVGVVWAGELAWEGRVGRTVLLWESSAWTTHWHRFATAAWNWEGLAALEEVLDGTVNLCCMLASVLYFCVVSKRCAGVWSRQRRFGEVLRCDWKV